MIFFVVKTKRSLLLHDRICPPSREVSRKMWIAYTELCLLCNGRPTVLENRAASNIKQYGKFTSGTKCTESSEGYQRVRLAMFPFDVIERTCSVVCGPGNS